MVSIKVSGVPWRKSIGGNRRSCRNVYTAMSEEGAPLSAKTNRCVVREKPMASHRDRGWADIG